MAKFVEGQKKLIAALRRAGRSIESLKKQYGATEKQINSFTEKYWDDDTFEVVKKPDDKEDN